MYRWILIVSLLLPQVACGDLGEPDGSYAAAEQAIVNGTRDPRAVDLTDGEILAIGWLYRARDPSSPFCTGTLISPYVVATAAHCLPRWGSANIGFGFGVEPSDPVATIPVAETYAHPRMDAALLVLSQDATEVVPGVEIIAPNAEPLAASQVGEAVQAGGFGDTYDDARTGKWFATVYVSVILADSVVVDGRGVQGICFGDSGGPIIGLNSEGDPVLLGVESNGDRTCVDEDTLTRVDRFYDWAQPVVDGGVPDGVCGDLDVRGRCDGDVLEWCHESEVKQRDCADEGLVCGFHDRVGHVCQSAGTEQPDPDDPDPDDPDPDDDDPDDPLPGGDGSDDGTSEGEVSGAPKSTGCQQTPSSRGSHLWLAAFGLVLLRRRAQIS